MESKIPFEYLCRSRVKKRMKSIESSGSELVREWEDRRKESLIQPMFSSSSSAGHLDFGLPLNSSRVETRRRSLQPIGNSVAGRPSYACNGWK